MTTSSNKDKGVRIMKIKQFIGKILLDFINARIEYVESNRNTYTFKLKKGQKIENFTNASTKTSTTHDYIIQNK